MGLDSLMPRNIHRWATAAVLALSGATGGYAAETDSDEMELDMDMDMDLSCIACHEDVRPALSATRHWGLDVDADQGVDAICVKCHGPAFAHVLSEQSDLIAYSQPVGQDAQAGNDVCLDCHKNTQLIYWHGSVHESEDLSCTACHVIHGNDKVQERSGQAMVCYRCHQDVRGQFLKPYNHPVREEKLTCSDCHQSHGGQGPSDLNGFTVTELCTNCHPAQRGPYLWEHPPVSENCLLCHNAHGSIHPGMLLARGPHLCQSCHQPTSDQRARHARLALGFSDPNAGLPGPGGGPAGTSRFVLSRNCLNCHFHVHGSNHPSGAQFER